MFHSANRKGSRGFESCLGNHKVAKMTPNSEEARGVGCVQILEKQECSEYILNSE